MAEEFTAQFVEAPVSQLLQTVERHLPDEGAIGDCYRTAIACLIGADRADDVPHFVAQSIAEGLGGWDTRRRARHWLRQTLGFDLMSVRLDAAVESGFPYLLSVRSQRGDWLHIVVARGREVIWDPSGVGGYTFDDRVDEECAEVYCTMYDPDPDEMVRRWEAEEAAELEVAS